MGVAAAVLLAFTVLLSPPAPAQTTVGGVCGRTAEVRDALLARVQEDDADVTDCSLVTSAHLEALTGTLALFSMRITGLESGDFAGLSNLVTLYLSGNELTELPAGIFDGLANLTTLSLYNNDLRTLPVGVFDGLANLENLYLYRNDLRTLPDGIFVRLAKLSGLHMIGNPGTASFLPTADAGTDQEAEPSATVRLDGSASSRVGPWGTNISYDWAVADGEGNPVTGITLTGADTATPSFVMPATESDGGFVFTLTVQGRGHSSQNPYKSTASVSVTFKALGELEVTSVALASAPTTGTTYGNGESIEVAVTFDEPATVTTSGGTPGIGLTVGTAAKTAGYLRGSGSRRLVFAYEVQAADTDADGVSVPADGIIRNGGQIANADGAAFGLAHDALADDAGHKVNGAATPLTGGVCGRTPQVRDELLALVRRNNDAVANCSQVTTAHLEALTGALNLLLEGIIGLKSGDFANLTNLVTLYLGYNDLQALPVGIFAGLANLENLYLSYNRNLQTLPAGIFAGLADLDTLYLNDNDLQTLPAGIFAGLANLESVYLYDNDLQTLPDGVFEGLAKLVTLDLNNNPGVASFRPTADVGLDREAEPGATVTLDGSASSGGPWGTNITYFWEVADGQGDELTGFPLTGADTAKPSFVMPATESEGGFLFLLTVRGRGHRGLDLYKSTDVVNVTFSAQAAPAVTSVGLASVPTNGTTYGNGESIEVVVTFEAPATVTTSGGTPGIGLTVGTAAKTAEYSRGSGSRRLVFAYEVQAADTDADGVSVPADGIILNGGQIANSGGAVFQLAHAALADDAAHKVSGAATPLTGGVCGRTPQVRAALLARVQVNDAAVADCSQVAESHLRALTGTLDLTARSIIGLKSGDFATLPSVSGLYLSYNDLETLPVAVFHGLANLRDLYLSHNDLRMLPDGTFNGLPNLRILYLDNNDLQTLPDGVFDGLANLTTLDLHSNDLETLSDAVFEALARLNTLYLHANPGTASFLPTADAGADQEARPSATVRLHGSATRGGPWGTNISHDWAVADGQGDPVTGLTLTGGNTATPSFTMPATEPNGGLVLTLTVQGRGHRGLGLYKSTDSVSVTFTALDELDVTSVALASAPTNGTTYGNGESIEVVVTFDAPATVTTSGGTPGIGLTVGTAAKTAGYVRGSGSRRLLFAYEVQAADTDTDGVSVPADSIILNGGQIEKSDGAVFQLAHAALADDAGHKVDGAATPLTGGVCGRTQQVRAALLALVQVNDDAVADCSQVTESHLRALIGTLDLTARSIIGLKSGDFANLPSVSGLYLSFNDLQTLPVAVFHGLANLRDLYLSHNDLRMLPDGTFNGLPNLRSLFLDNNDLQTLPDGVFDGLANLRTLGLYNNDLQTLSDGVFEGLARLNTLDLYANPGVASFLPTANAGTDQEAEPSATVRLNGSASSRGGPWGTNISYDWAVADGQGDPVTDLTLTGRNTATPSFTLPSTEYAGGLAFTLTVQGRGHRGRNLYKSTASVRVVVGEAAAGVTSVVLASTPTIGTTYGNGESIEVVVTFDAPATVTTSGGTPGIGLTVGTAAKTAGYLRGSGSRRLVFAYEVQAADTDSDGVSVPADAIIRNGGRFANADGVAFELAHAALADDAGHKVNGAGTPLTGGVCGRTQQVRDELLALVRRNDDAVADCSQVTTTHLQALTGALNLIGEGLIGLKSGDFANLLSVSQIFLYDNDLQTLPAGIFEDLANLRELTLYNNDLQTLSAGIFRGLAKLEGLYLYNNDLQTLPDGVFEGLANLSTLNLSNNNLQTLPDRAFEGLVNLRNLHLNDNNLQTPRDAVFDALEGLTSLYLNDNNIQTLPDGVFQGLGILAILDLDNNPGTASFLPTADAGMNQRAEPSATVSLDGSASRGGPWGTNITYAWAVADGEGNSVAGITLTGGDTATPSFTMPTTEPASGLVFTLTVQGRGHHGQSLYKSTDSGRVAMDVLPLVWVNAVDATVTEGTNAQFHFSRSRDSTSRLEVQVNISGHRKVMTSGTTSTVATFEAGATETTLDLATQADRFNEGDGEVSVTIRSSPGAYEINGTGAATVLVRDDDIPEVTLRWVSPVMTVENNVWVGSMTEGQAIEFEVECTGSFVAATQTIAEWARIPLRFQELLNHPIAVGGYNEDYKVRFPCAGDSGTRRFPYSNATRRYVGPNNGRLEVDLFPQVLSLDEMPGFNNSSFGIKCYLDSRSRSPEDIRFCPKYTLGAVTSARIEVTNRNPTVIVEAIEEAVIEGQAARFRVKRIWEPDVLAAYSTAFNFTITAAGRYAQSVPATSRTFAIGDTEIIIEIPTVNDAVPDTDGLVTFELEAGLSDVQASNIGGSYETYDRLPGITPPGKSSRTVSVRILEANNAAPTGAHNTVTVDEDQVHTFQAPEFGFADPDLGDTLASVTIVSLPDAGKGTLALGGTPVTAAQSIAASALATLTYAPPANANLAAYASFTFKVSDGVADSAQSYTMTIDVTAVNDAATGVPTISGTARVGQVLTAEAGAVADVDGLPAPGTFAWQWLLVDGGDETVIPGATASTYTLMTADVGKKLKARVSFTDLGGSDESLTSAAYPDSASGVENTAPTSADRTVTTAEDTSYTFGSVDFAFADMDGGDALMSVKVMTLPGAGRLALGGVAVTANQAIGTSDLGGLVFTPAANAHGAGYASFTFKVSDGVSDSAVANTLTVDVTAVNDPASGLAITGTVRKGQTLTADTTNIVDADGLTSPNYRYQWVRVDGGTETDLGTASTHAVTSADQGKKLKVQVTLTDDDGNTETLEVETVLVPANAAPTSANWTVTTAEDTSYTFGSVAFAFADMDGGDALMSVKVMTLPGAGRLALGGVAVTANQAIGTSDLGGLVFTPAANAHGAGYASFTFKVSDGVSDSAVANTMTVDVTAVNDPASGLAITGTAREGQTLTADTTNIVDADGLTSPNYRYQWVRVDGGTETDLGTASTHAVTSADQGKKLKVKVTLTDDDSNTETLEVETVLVSSNAAPTSANRTVTTAEDTSYTFGSVDFAFDDTDTDDVLMSVKVVTLPGAGRLALGGVAVTANDVVAVADIPMLVFTPAANAHGAGYASFTFKVSDGVSDSAVANTMTVDVTAVNDPASGLAITGTAREGQTLTADTTNIVDADGLTSPNYRYQWVRVDGGTETDLGTASTHAVTSADQGKKLKVQVTLTDDDSNTETLEVETVLVSSNAAPTSADRTVTTTEDTSYTFGSVDFAFADMDGGDALMSVKVMTLPGAGRLALGGVAVTANQAIGTSDLGGLVFTPAANAHGAGYASFTFKVSDGVSDSAVANTLTVDVTAVNDPASGLAITGTAREGQTLTADTTNIVDADGLTSPNYRYQWVRVDGGDETDLGTASTHAVTSADQGKKLKVQVTLTDDDSNTETLEVETVLVSSNAAPTSANRTVTTAEDTSYTFGSVDFAFADMDGGDALMSVKVMTLPGAGRLALGGVAVTANQAIGTSDLGGLVFTPAANAHGAGYASFTFKVSDGVSDSAVANTLTVDVTAVNDPASGLAITGTAREGQTLTADTTNIVDADGLTSPNYRYQWVRVDGGDETDLGTASTHVVTSADQGKKLKVQVTLTDDDSNTETLEVETVLVSSNAAPTSADRTVTTTEDTSYTFGSVDFAFADMDGGDALMSVKVMTLPGAGRLALGGVAVTANQAIGTSDLGGLVFTPAANAHGAGYASFTFKVSDGVSDSAVANTMTVDVTAVNDPASGLAITGTAREGQTLTADTTNIVDADGLTSPNYRYQWVRVDGGDETDLGTASTHVVTSADQGKKLKVQVTLTDDDSNTETLEVETVLVSSNAAPTSADRTVTTTEDTSYTFGSVDFAFADMDGGDALMSVKVMTLPGAGRLALGGVAVTANDVVAVADIPMLVFTPAANAHGAGYASFTFKVSDGVSDSAVANTMTVDVTAVNDPASGLAIAGDPILSFGTHWGHTVKVLESDTVWHRFTVDLRSSRGAPPDGNPQEPLTIPLVVTHVGGATPEDYEGIPSSVTFAVGESVTDFFMRAIPDDRREPGEGLRLDFGPLPAGLRKGSWGPYETIEFVDQDLPRVTALFGAESYTATEGGAAARVSIHLSEPVEIEPLDVRLSVQPGGGATTGDYSVPTVVRFAVGEQTKTIAVTATDDTDDDDGESVTLSFVEDPNDRVVTGVGSGRTTVALEDNDGPAAVEVSFGAATYTATEGGADARVRVQLDKAPGRAVTVPLTAVSAGGATTADYSVQANVAFGPNETSKTFLVTATDDADPDGGESVRIGFGALPDGVLAGRPAAAVVTLADGTEQTFVVSFGTNPTFHVQAREGKVGKRLGVYLSNDPWGSAGNAEPRRPVTIPLVVTYRGGATGADHTPIPASVTFEVGSGRAGFDVRAIPDGQAETGESLRIDFGELPPGVTKGRWGYETIEFVDEEPSPASLWVADAEVQEGSGAVLAFTVTLSHALTETVTVEYNTVDGTASAGADYTDTSGTLTFTPGQTSQTVSVPVLDDSHDEGSETLTLRLRHPWPARVRLADAQATGTVNNTDAMPQAWFARFGRADADHVIEAVSERWQDGPRASQLTVGGRRAGDLFGWTGHDERDATDKRDEAVASDAFPTQPPALSGAAGTTLGRTAPGMSVNPIDMNAAPAGPGGVDGEAGATLGGRAARSALLRAVGLPELGALTDLRALLMGSSFSYSGTLDEDGRARTPGWLGEWSAWGRTAASRFSGAEGELSLDGEVATAMLGFDSRWDRWLAGLVVSYSEGQGAYTHPTATGGAVASTMTGLHPYARYELNERTSLWGVLGYGVGELSLTPERSATALGTDLTNAMAAFGGRTALSVRTGRAGRFELAIRSDARLTNTASEAIEGLAGAAGQTGRVRLTLEGSGSMPLATGGVLKPKLEAGLRYDAGDAETGAGLEFGGGLGYAAGRLSVEVSARGLLAHEDTGYEEWGFSGSIAYTPSEDGRGLSMKLGSAWGATQSGVQSLWSRQDASGLVRNAAFDAAQRYQVELRYGLDGRKGRARWTPYMGVESGDGSSRALRLGVKLTSGRGLDAGLELARRQGRAGADPEQAVQLRGALRW